MFLQSLVLKIWRSRTKMEQDSITAQTLLFFHGVGNTTDRLPGLCPAGTFILKWLIHGAWESIYGSEISFTYFTETWKRSTDLCFHYRVSFHSQHSKKLCRIGETPSILGGNRREGFPLRPCLTDNSTQALPFVDTGRHGTLLGTDRAVRSAPAQHFARGSSCCSAISTGGWWKKLQCKTRFRSSKAYAKLMFCTKIFGNNQRFPFLNYFGI